MVPASAACGGALPNARVVSNRSNAGVRRVYGKLGCEEHDRVLMTKRIGK
jgi:hypothetical protein